jgi:hypothetical protein
MLLKFNYECGYIEPWFENVISGLSLEAAYSVSSFKALLQ